MITSTIIAQIPQKYTNQEIIDCISKLNKEFEDLENGQPASGYLVTVNTKDSSLSGRVTPYGRRNNRNESLSGIYPDQENKCVFCKFFKEKSVSVLRFLEDGIYELLSLSRQLLVIPEEHYPHWFATPLPTQVLIFRHILQIREENPDKIKGPIEFHCGAASGQTIFHLHGRTGVYLP